MTREEAEKLALSMPRLKALVAFRNDVLDRDWTGIDILFRNGGRAGIGNPNAIQVARKALLAELDRQIEAEAGTTA